MVLLDGLGTQMETELIKWLISLYCCCRGGGGGGSKGFYVVDFNVVSCSELPVVELSSHIDLFNEQTNNEKNLHAPECP